MIRLPIDALIPQILASLERTPNLVIEAPPGAGKTTRVPPALLAAGAGEVLVLEPRRLAARMAARRVASEMGESVGDTTGYQVRFEEVAGPKTRLRFMTEGVLTRRMLSDPRLRAVSAVILDEFHERHLEGDLALALLSRLQRNRPDLRIVVMSATLESGPVAQFLGACPVLRSEGRLFETAIRYTPSSPKPLEELIAGAVDSLVREGLDGDVLAFLPGAGEIRRAMRACEALASRAGILVLPLHGDLSPEEQDRAVSPAGRAKLILSTNVAESSITIEAVTAVIDSGLARVASQSPWSGLPQLTVTRVSKASADQRAGRAGRTAPGRVVRLYPAEDYHRRPAHDTPEIARAELSQLVLELAELGIHPSGLDWLEAPPESAIAAAADLLRRMGALDSGGAITNTGSRMAGLPLHPRLARLVIEAGRRGAGDDGCAAAALLSAGQRLPETPRHDGPSDVLALMESEWEPRSRQIYRQIRRSAAPTRRACGGDEAVLLAVLAAFPDRVARRRNGNELLLAGGGSAMLSPASVVSGREFMVAVDIEERRERGLPLVRIASGIEPEWLLDLFPESVSERSRLEWNRAAERVERVSALLYDSIAIEESRVPAPAGEDETTRFLAARALEAGPGRFADAEELEEFLARVEFASGHSSLRPLTDDDVRSALEFLASGARSFAELEAAARNGGLLRALEGRLDSRLLSECAPARIRLPGGRQVKVRYARKQPPWIASRLQDFFGMKETPRVAGGKVPLVVHLLAPNHRPVQTTTDLAGFWQRLYPQLRRELGRRYPRHAWPEDPQNPG